MAQKSTPGPELKYPKTFDVQQFNMMLYNLNKLNAAFKLEHLHFPKNVV